MQKSNIIKLLLFFTFNFTVSAQVNCIHISAGVYNVPITNPVYDFLLRAETKGLLPRYSLSMLPWQKHKIVSALKLIRESDSLLSNNEKKILNNFEREFGIVATNRAVVLYSETDKTVKKYIPLAPLERGNFEDKDSSLIPPFQGGKGDVSQVLSLKIFSDYEKMFYHYADTVNNVTVIPLASADFIDDLRTNNNLLMGTAGVRFFGTLTNNFGYYLQLTSTAMLRGDSALALLDKKFTHNIKFLKYNSDADISESHIAYQNKWFYGSIGRETKLNGAGLSQRLYVNDLSPAFDAITLAARFNNFEYTFSHNSLIGMPLDAHKTVGVQAIIPNKFLIMHNYTFKPEWGEISIFESVTYSRDFEFAYISPLSFLNSLEHSLHDRDRVNMGLSGVYRPFRNFQIKGTWYLDDLKFSEIGKKYWSNKTAWNIAGITSAIKNTDLGLEYTRVEPYTYTHYNPQNAAVNDGILFSGYNMPNSDRWTLLCQYWWGNRYPIKLNFSYTRHGRNIYDEDGNLLLNVGGDPLQNFRWSDTLRDKERVNFLAGDLVRTFNMDFTVGYEFIRNFSIHFLYNLKHERDIFSNYYRLILRFSDF